MTRTSAAGAPSPVARPPRAWRGRSRAALTAAAALTAVGALTAAPSAGAATPSPSSTSWPKPGAGTGQAQTVAGQTATVRPVKNPLVIIDQNTEAGPGTSYTLGADVLFATGQDTLSGSADAALQALAQQIIAAGVTGRAEVVGHTDDVDSDADNLVLSRRRAATVTARLTSLLAGHGITLTAVGRGETQPLVPNTDDAARARNRRVSVVFAGLRPGDRDLSDIAVPGNQPAPAATGTAPAGSIVGTTRTFTAGSGNRSYTVRLDVTAVTRLDSLLVIETTTQLLSADDFYHYDALFTGHLNSKDQHRTALYDRGAGQELPVVVDGAGTPLRDGVNELLKPGSPLHGWFLFPTPTMPGDLQLYLPAFGVLTVPAGSITG